MLDPLLPLGRDLPAEVAGGEDDVHLVLGERGQRAGDALGSGAGEDLVADQHVPARPPGVVQRARPTGRATFFSSPAQRLADQVERGLEVVAGAGVDVVEALALERVAVEGELVLQVARAALGRPDVQVDRGGSCSHCGPIVTHGAFSQVTTREGLGRPSTPAIQRLVSTSAPRSTPVSMPRPCSIQTRSSVARLPVALSAYGQPPRPPALASKVVMPCCSAAKRVGERLAVGVVEVHAPATRWAGPASLNAVSRSRDVARRADPDRVAERELAGAEVEEALADLDHLVDRHLALPRVAEAHADVGAHVQPGLAGPRDRRLEHRELLVEAAVEVALREGLGGAAEDRDVATAELQRPVEPALVGHQHRQVLAGRHRGPVDQQVISSPASASWGTHFGCTKLVASTTGSPAASRRWMNSALASTGTMPFSFCRPSRGPTS